MTTNVRELNFFVIDFDDELETLLDDLLSADDEEAKTQCEYSRPGRSRNIERDLHAKQLFSDNFEGYARC